MSDFTASLWGLTLADVENVTGAEVEQVDLTMAAEVIEIYVNRTEAASANMRKRDIRFIKKAICWQAAWLEGQPDFHERMNLDTMDQDGQRIAVSPAASMFGREYALTLAPMAARALKNLSWKTSRSISVARETENATSAASAQYAFLTDETPLGWQRLA